MRKLILLLLPLVIAVAAAFFIKSWATSKNDPGFVVIGMGQWSMETSLIVFAFLLLLTFVGLYFLFRLLGWFWRLPKKMKHKGLQKEQYLSHEALFSGLTNAAEGNWEKAEKSLIKHASSSGASLIHYLTAAKAAHSRGAAKKRDEYLHLAAKSHPDAELTIGLAKAKLLLSDQQFETAVENLTHLHAMSPQHGTVLKLLHRGYKHLGDWDALRKIIPDLRSNKVLMEAEVKLLEIETHSALLKKQAKLGNTSELHELWQTMPKHIRSVPHVSAVYFAAMIKAGKGDAIEGELKKAIDSDFDQTLLILYGCVESSDTAKQIGVAEKWLKKHPKDPVLLKTLGKLSGRSNNPEKCESYLLGSLQIEPSVEAYRLLGDLLQSKGDQEKSIDCYKKGMEFASNSMVQQSAAG